jgi:hypothetical protein
MENYKKNLYILTYYHTIEELRDIHTESKELFNKNKCENLLKVRRKIETLIKYIENIPSFGEPEKIGERKKKNSMYYEFKKHILTEIIGINENINDALNTTRGKLLKYASTIERIENLGKEIQTYRVYSYNSKKEDIECLKHIKRYREYKESFKNNSM